MLRSENNCIPKRQKRKAPAVSVYRYKPLDLFLCAAEQRFDHGNDVRAFLGKLVKQFRRIDFIGFDKAFGQGNIDFILEFNGKLGAEVGRERHTRFRKVKLEGDIARNAGFGNLERNGELYRKGDRHAFVGNG